MNKRILYVLLALLGLQSLAQAQDYFGVKLGFPYIFSAQYGHDFEASNRGLSLRGFVGSTLLGSSGFVGAGATVLGRMPMGEAGSSAYLGLEGSLVLSFGNAYPLGGSGSAATSAGVLLGVLMGLEFVLGQGWSLCFELQPLSAFIPFAAGAQVTNLPFFTLGVNVRL